MTFREGLSAVRLKCRLSRVAFAKRLGVDTKTLKNWEMGLHAPLRSKKTEVDAIIRRIVALKEIDGEEREIEFLTNQLE